MWAIPRGTAVRPRSCIHHAHTGSPRQSGKYVYLTLEVLGKPGSVSCPRFPGQTKNNRRSNSNQADRRRAAHARLVEQTHRAPVQLQLRVVVGTHGEHQALGRKTFPAAHLQAQIDLLECGARA